MKERLIRQWVGLILAALFSAGAALAQAPPLPRPQGPPAGPDQGTAPFLPGEHSGDALQAIRIIARYLDLSEDQGEQVRGILRAAAEQVRGLNDEIRALESALREELQADAPEPEVVGVLVIQISEKRQAARAVHQDAVEAVRDLLTEEQLSKAEAVRQASRLEPVVHAFRTLSLLPPPNPPESGE